MIDNRAITLAVFTDTYTETFVMTSTPAPHAFPPGQQCCKAHADARAALGHDLATGTFSGVSR